MAAPDSYDRDRMTRRAPWLIGLAIAIVLGGVSARRVEAQADLRDTTQPISVVNTGGHSAPVRSLIFASRDGSQLLSGGLDKIVNVWNLKEDPPRPARTIRPRLWRGYAGAIYAMALSPTPDRKGQRTLAIAGYGVMNNRGEIGLFRFPGSNDRPTGDLEAQLPSGGSAEKEPQGHLDSVTCLAFDPRGGFLCSGSNDSTVRIWDLRARRTVAVLRGHTKRVKALAFSPDGRRLVTAGADGLVMLWDVDKRVSTAVAKPDPRRQRRGDLEADAINALGLSPDGRWVVIGRENGDLIRYDAADLRNGTLLPRRDNRQGAVEALAISPDGTKLVTSVISQRTQPSERPRVECDVELRTMPEGALQSRLAVTSDRVRACAFSPDNRRVAFAGGDNQAITLMGLDDPRRPSIEMAGQGATLWDVGFSRDSLAIGLARRRPDRPDPPREYEDFDLQGRRLVPFAPEELSRAVTTWEGWTVRPVDPRTLDVRNAQGKGYRLSFDPVLDGRWWSYSFLPPGPGHPRPAVAIACEVGVAIYGLDDGRRTRLFAGHNGPVYSLAPSPDGNWLVTGSSDQTARFWTLAGCDTLAPLGAQFAPEGGRLGKVSRVEPRSFAEKMGMRVGDLVDKFYIGGVEKADFKDLESVPPNTKMIEFLVTRDGKQVPLGTTKRDSPAMSLFPALDREWVLWTPKGYYDTSAIGDRKYLGWHRNRDAPDLTTDYFSFDNFERELRQPGPLIRFLETANLDALTPDPKAGPVQPVPREPERVVAEDRLPAVQVVEPSRPAFDPLVVRGASLPVRVQASTEDPVQGRGLIRSLQVLVDGGRTPEIVFDPPSPKIDRLVTLNLNPGRHTVSVTALNDRDKSRTVNFDVIAQEPPGPPPRVDEIDSRPPQLVVLAIGADRFAGQDPALPPIPFAVEDSRDVASFLKAPLGKPRFQRVIDEDPPLHGRDATADRIVDALDRLDERRKKGELGQGDSVFVVLESHLLSFGTEGMIAGAEGSVPAARIADTLGQLADYGCKVMLLVDAWHKDGPPSPKGQRMLTDWARALYRKNVITFVASSHGPSLRATTRGHGAFAEGIINSLNVQGAARLNPNAQRDLTLFDFQDRVARNVQALTGRRQHARCYIPDTIPSQSPLLDPPSRRPSKELRAAND